MRSLTILTIFCALLSCKSDKKQNETADSNAIKKVSNEKKVLTVSEKIAKAHGIEHWNKVNKIAFTFNVDVNGNHSERSWVWKPKTDEITMISANDTINYNRKSVDSLSLNADRGFINDKFWLLAPFQLVWDSGTEVTKPIITDAPISGEQMNKITLTYTGDGGYTPGDAYDFFYTDEFKIKEWVFRKGNASDPSLTTTFENYENFKGIEIAKDHKQGAMDWNLYFTDIDISLE